MTLNRIQKLLFSEYSDFEDMVLVESPFAETTRDGRGIRQVQIGLTPTKLVLATDIIKRASEYPIFFFPGRVDAEIECLELVSIFPIELVTLSVFRRRRRKVLKAKFHDGNPSHSCKTVYFELGGSDKRKMFWNLWCERVKFLSPEDKGGSSLTETSVQSSTSSSSLYVTRSRQVDDQIWQYYAGGDARVHPLKWTERDLFFGDKMEQIRYNIEPVHVQLALKLNKDEDDIKTLYRRKNFNSKSSLSSHLSKTTATPTNRKVEHINRFGEGIEEGCCTGLYLPAIECSRCSISVQSIDSLTMLPKVKEQSMDFIALCEDGVQIWETRKFMNKPRHPRRYGICTYPDFYMGLGLYRVTSPDAKSVRLKRVLSVISLKEEEGNEFEFRINQNLSSSASCESLSPWIVGNNSLPLKFWTSGYWFDAISTVYMYRKTQEYLRNIRLFLKEKYSRTQDGSVKVRKTHKKTLNYLKKLFHKDEVHESLQLTQLKQMLQYDSFTSIWDFDSTTLAFQITMIDALLFLKIKPEELRKALSANCIENCVSLRSWLVFSHRCSCLIATEVLKTSELKTRARLISRFINTAEKCHRLHNFQSCRNIITGLQSPAIFRLKETWARVRQSHATKYQMFEKLSRLYKDPRLLCYQKAFYRASQDPPYLPTICHILTVLLGHSTDISEQKLKKNSQDFKIEMDHKRILLNTKENYNKPLPKLLKQFISAFKIYNSSPEKSSEHTDIDTNHSDSQVIQLNGNHEDIFGSLKIFFEPLTNDNITHLFEGEELLRVSQVAAARYDLTENQLAKEFLLKAPYQEHFYNYLTSFQIENQVQ